MQPPRRSPADHHALASALRLILIVLIACIALAAAIATAHNHLLRQPGAALLLTELAAILAVYTAAIFLEARLDTARWSATRRAALAFGVVTAVIETSNIALENFAPQLVGHAAVSVSFMLITFLLWAAAAVWTPHSATHFGLGLLAAVESAAICMLVAVAIGFPIEVFLKPPDPHVVATWAEFHRSGWSDPQLFAIANSIDSGCTHLLLAPVIALVFATVALLAKRLFLTRSLQMNNSQ